MARARFPLALVAALSLVAVVAAAETPPGTPEPVMDVISLDQWDAILDRRKSDVAVVDVWASWCVSCIERFPKMVEMADRYEGRNVRFITLNMDDPRDQAGIDWANGFLAEIGAGFENYHLAENLTVSFEQLDLQALPVVLIYDGSGGERYRLTNNDPNRQFTEADVEAAIRELLAET